MKIVVIGRTGLIGSKLVEKLRSDGHELLEALDGARVVVDVSDASRNLLATEMAAGVGHHVMLSVVGAERLSESSYFGAKLAQEEVVKAGPVPYTILRATQFFEVVAGIANGDPVRLPAALVQPVAADDVAGTLADLAVGAPLNDTVELAGPELFRLDEVARRVLTADLDDRSLIPGDDARIASTRFEDWLSQSATPTHHNRKELPWSPPSSSSTAPSPSPRAGTPSSIRCWTPATR